MANNKKTKGTSSTASKEQQKQTNDNNPPTKTYKKKKELPSVAYLLAHGDPETAHLPKTWKETIGYPLALALIFGVSLVVFHHFAQLAPRKRIAISGMQRLPLFEPDRVKNWIPPTEARQQPTQDEEKKEGPPSSTTEL
mmetsp:Transcript_23452/g.38203  ORF Transcript_23452/g.38203 Transcript_23452/m.38203 type:complete len:139 (-) Transcript_23452:1292-1708(-)|eukprot:CAMPEP_0178835772 /NCGR_PEP_ID=MMETSP0746-20121128/11810_1 /TAXON_ID=913974 /ORGANISM="Nitzschia punctata, Strain CCMP561" /LENGTH=138 /DNA_ID=CAMNT_0020498379 /DNA_START=127 /DNA_END=543 /DNA_ORIENTATION=-